MIYSAGRIFQLIGLIAMPSSMWVAHFQRDERGSIAIFLSSILVFVIGYVLTVIGKKLS